MDKKRERGTLEIYTGAGTIFGVSGGVMEAALRTAYFVLSGEELKNADIEIVRGHNNAIVEATIPVPIKAKAARPSTSASALSTAPTRVSRKSSIAFASTRTATTSSK